MSNEIRLTPVMVSQLDTLNLSHLYWDDGMTSFCHLDLQQQNGFPVPADILAFAQAKTIKVDGDPIRTINVGTNKYTKVGYIMQFQCGAGGNISSYYRLINGVSMSNSGGLCLVQPILIVGIVGGKVDAGFDNLRIEHTDSTGRDSQTAWTGNYNQSSGRMINYSNLEILIPGLRRIRVRASGSTHSSPQILVQYYNLVEV